MKKPISGKVRDIYEISSDRLIIVTSDRISAFDVVLNKPVPGKGRLLNAISLFWFDYTESIIPNHIISSDLGDMPESFRKPEFEGRTVLVKKLRMLPFECVVRGYMFGHLWQSYSESGEFCKQRIKEGYKLAEKLLSPIFTPSTKASTDHDEYVSFSDVEAALGVQLANKLRDVSLRLYKVCFDFAYSKGIIIADAKFEFGLDEKGELILADELFTPDSSRFWSVPDYKVGGSPKSYDKQLLRDWLKNNEADGRMQFDNVPDDVLTKTAEIYAECLEIITND